MKKELVLAGLCLVFFASFASARLMISEPEDVYSLGDKLYITVEGIRGGDSGNLNINLDCGNVSVNLLKISARAFSPEGGQSYSLPYKVLTSEDLEISSLSRIVGNCQVSVGVGDEKVSTDVFEISNNISIEASVDKLHYDPGEEITLSLSATKSNGHLVSGFVEGSNASDFSKEIENGALTEVFSMSDTAEAGAYVLNLFVYDVSEGDGILNQGLAKVLFKINQVPSFIDTGLSAVEITPEENLTISTDIYDQSGKEMDGDVSLLIVSPDGGEIQRTIKSGDFVALNFPLNATAGVWSIFSFFLEINEEDEFEILELQKAEFEFQGSILIVKNVGNARYQKNVDVKIGDTLEELVLNMDIGEERRFNLKAPDGEYEIIVNDGDSSASRSVVLTGNAISIDDLRNVGIFKNYSVIWIFLIVVLGGVGLVLFFKYRKKSVRLKDKVKKVPGKIKKIKDKVKGRVPEKYSSKVSDTLHFTNKSPTSQSLDEHEEKDGMIDLTETKVGKAESSLVLKGERNSSTVIALRIKNYEDLGREGRKRVANIVAGVKKEKGLVDWRGEYIFVIFSPLATKTFKNELLAAKAGFDIFEKINLGNKKFKDKISFNIGINSGDLVASKKKGKLQYTSIGSTIALAKKIADSGSGKLLISNSVRKKLLKDLKSEKAEAVGKTDVYEVSKIIDRSSNQEKLTELLKRMERG